MTCATGEHPEFIGHLDVARLTDTEDGPVVAYSATLRVECAACGEPMVFLGLPLGLSPRHPTVDLAGVAATLPIRPESAPPEWGLDGPGVSVRFDPMPGRDAN